MRCCVCQSSKVKVKTSGGSATCERCGHSWRVRHTTAQRAKRSEAERAKRDET